MNKDKTILNLIERLKLLIDFSKLHIVDHWEGDLCAIGLKKGNRTIYISTFKFINDEAARFDYDLEIADESDENIFKVLKEGRAVSEDGLVYAIKSFLEI